MKATEKNLIDANNALEHLLRTSNPRYINVLDEKIKMVNDADIMAHPSNYKEFFDLIEAGRQLYRRYNNIITDMDNKINEFKEQSNLVLEKLDKLAESVNKNKFKYGLKGQIKQSIKLQREMPEMTEEQQHAFEQPYAQTPADILGRGGKKTRRSKRPKSKRRKTKKR